MIYGNTIIYKYTELDGNKEVEKQLKRVFSPITLIKYQGYLGREFMTDLFNLQVGTAKGLSQRLKDKIEKGEDIVLDDLTDEDIKSLTPNISSQIEFYLNLVVCMIATEKYPKVIDFAETLNSLPLSIYSDEEFFAELMELISFAIKKNSKELERQIAKHR